MTVSQKHIKILLIDDEQFIRSTMRQIFGMIGVPPSNIYEAASCEQGMTQTLRVRPDLVLCDIHMPDQDGFTYVAQLRDSAISDVARTPVVMLTSEAHQDAVLTAKQLKVQGYIIKPVSAATVKRAAEAALKMKLE